MNIARADETPAARAKVAQMLEEASELGSGEAAAAIANWIHYGIHYEKDANREYQMSNIAASRGVASAHFTLGSMYEGGIRGVLRKNLRLAYYHYLESALLGDADAYMEVSRCLFYGIGVQQDVRASRIWRRIGRSNGGQFALPRDQSE